MLTNTAQTSIVCETSLILLRKFNEGDVEALLSFLSDPEVMHFSITGPETRQDIQTKYLPGCLRRYSRDGLGPRRKLSRALLLQLQVCEDDDCRMRTIALQHSGRLS